MAFLSILDPLGYFQILGNQDEVEYPCSVINVASGHESESNLDKQLLDSLEVGCESTGHDYADSKILGGDINRLLEIST